MRKIGLILLLMFLTLCMFAKSNTSSASQTKNTHIVLTYNKTEMDTTPNSVTLDSARIVLFNRFLSDSIPYYRTDSLLRSELDTLQREVSQLITEAEEGGFGRTKSWVLILLFVLASLGLGIIVCVLFLQRNLKRNSKRIDKRKVEIENLQKAIERSQNNYRNQGASSIEKELKEIKIENSNLKNRVAALEDALRKNEASSMVASKQQSSLKPIETQKLLYADSIIDGVFSHVKEQKNDDTIFVLKLKNENTASISIFEQAHGRVIANASYLEGCEKQIIGNSSVEIVREGKAERGFNGKWKVVSPLKVEIR